MAALDTTRIATTGSFGLVGRIGAYFVSAVNAAIEWNDARVTRNALSGLTGTGIDQVVVAAIAQGVHERTGQRHGDIEVV